MGQLAEWKCHKVVKAGKFIRLMPAGTHHYVCVVEDINGVETLIEMPFEAFSRGLPAEGHDYLIVYDDGYKSWSPAKAFEDGYARLLS